jgi:hypothetical protein
VINPITWAADRIAARITDYPRVPASHDCSHCGVLTGQKHRLAGCEGNERDVYRRLVLSPGQEMSDDEVDRDQSAALEQHRRNMREKGES